MRVVFVNDSGSFDGFSPLERALDGPEKALANLATALAVRGHTVTVCNDSTLPVEAHGVHWRSADTPPDAADVLVACGDPGRLDFVANASRRVFWSCGASTPAAAAHANLTTLRPTVVLSSRAQQAAWSGPADAEAVVIEPGIAASFLEDAAMAPADPPRAIATAHPLAGLDWLIKLWTDRIHPELPQATLHLYSAWLETSRNGGAVPAAIQPIADRAMAAGAQGVVVERPQADPQMADAYRQARVHLHPGAASDAFGFTLQESQAVGLPAVVRATNPVMIERVTDGQTGAIAAGDPNFAGAALRLLSDRMAFDQMSANARLLKRGRSWAVVAAEWEERFA